MRDAFAKLSAAWITPTDLRHCVAAASIDIEFFDDCNSFVWCASSRRRSRELGNRAMSMARTTNVALARCRLFDHQTVRLAVSADGLCRYDPPISEPAAGLHGL